MTKICFIVLSTVAILLQIISAATQQRCDEMIECLYKPFKRWAYFGSVYIISDTHFADPQTREVDPDWPSPEEQVAILKKCMTSSDTLIHLGDVGDASYMDALPGYKVLIMGNHDSISKVGSHFNEVYDGPLMISKKVLLSHEKMVVPGVLNIHGHEHRGEPRMFYDDGSYGEINLASDVCHYIPMNLGIAIKNGLLSHIKDIHRLTIDAASRR